MVARVDGEPAFVLHVKPFRETSAIVTFLTQNHGVISGVVKGIRSGTKSAQLKKALVQPLIPLLISWGGRSDLKSIYQLEGEGQVVFLQGDRLFSALYLNEILYRLIKSTESIQPIFQQYCRVIAELSGDEMIEPLLRRFEFFLFSQLGYGIDFSCDKAPLQKENYYLFSFEEGFVPVSENHRRAWQGEDLLQVAAQDFSGDSARRVAKQLTRKVIADLLGGDVEIHSRALFR